MGNKKTKTAPKDGDMIYKENYTSIILWTYKAYHYQVYKVNVYKDRRKLLDISSNWNSNFVKHNLNGIPRQVGAAEFEGVLPATAGATPELLGAFCCSVGSEFGELPSAGANGSLLLSVRSSPDKQKLLSDRYPNILIRKQNRPGKPFVEEEHLSRLKRKVPEKRNVKENPQSGLSLPLPLLPKISSPLSLFGQVMKQDEVINNGNKRR